MSQDSEHSSYREKLIEHLFVSELLKLSWLHHKCSLEVAQPEVDNSGYDLIAEAHGTVRHIQLKASFIGGKTARQKINSKLAEKPSGCVVWIKFNKETLQLGPFFYFGAGPGLPLPDLGTKIAKHVKANKDGIKGERPNIRQLSKGAFRRIESIEGVYSALFGGA
jgi:hypothetical protein